MQHLVCFILLLLSPFYFITAQPYKSFNYTTDNGLPSSEVYHAIQDTKGYMWFASDQGVIRYDGYQFTSYNVSDGLMDNTTIDLYEDYKGRIWFIGLNNKLCYYFNNTIHKYAYNDSLLNIKKLSSNHSAKSTFYVDSLDNVYFTPRKECPIKVDKNGYTQRVKFVQKDSVILRIDDSIGLSNFTVNSKNAYINDNGNKKIKLSSIHNFNNLLFANTSFSDDKILISQWQSLFEINRENGEYTTLKYPDMVIWLSIDSNNIIWVGTFKNGIFGYKNKISNKPDYHLLTDKSVSSVCRDSEGGYWFTTLHNGIYNFPSLGIYNINGTNTPSLHSVLTISAHNNQIWFGGYNSPYLHSLHNGTVEKYKFRIAYGYYSLLWYNNKHYTAFGKSANHKISKSGGILEDEGSNIDDKIGYFSASCITKQGNLLLAYKGDGYTEIRDNKTIHHKLPKQISNTIYAIQQDENGGIWLATEKGLFVHHNDSLDNWGSRHKLFKQKITCIIRHQEEMWLGTQGYGLIKYTNGEVTNITKNEGLPSNSIYDIIIKQDNIWIGTNKGIVCVDKNNPLKTNGLWTTAQGINDNEVFDLEILNDTIYAGTRKGLSYFPCSLANNPQTPPPVYINKISISEQDTSILKNYKLGHNQNSLAISYTGLSYQRNSPLKYKYKMLGIDEQWHYTTAQEVKYSELPPGKYQFKVLAINNSGIESIQNANIKIVIKKPYWESYWFLISMWLLIILIITGIVSTFYNIRIRRLKKENSIKYEMNKLRLKAASSQMNPHFVFNTLNAAQYHILDNNAEEASTYLSKLAHLMRVILKNSFTSQISLKAELEALNQYIELEVKRFNNGLKYTCKVDESINQSKIMVPPLILQPYVENAILHGLGHKKGEKKLSLRLKKHEKSVQIIIEDNGIGRKLSEKINRNKQQYTKHESVGIEITHQRLKMFEEIKKNRISVEIIDLYDEYQQPSGTKVVLSFKI